MTINNCTNLTTSVGFQRNITAVSNKGWFLRPFQPGLSFGSKSQNSPQLQLILQKNNLLTSFHNRIEFTLVLHSCIFTFGFVIQKKSKKIFVKEIECIPSKWSSWWKLNFIGFKQHDSNSKFRLKRLSIKFGHCIYWQFITVDFSWIKVFVVFSILHRLFCYNIYWMVSVKCFIHCAKMVGLHAVYTFSFFRFMVLREVFKPPQ